MPAVLGLASCVAVGVASAAEPAQPTLLTASQMDSVTAAGGGKGDNGNHYGKHKHKHKDRHNDKHKDWFKQVVFQSNIVIFYNIDGNITINGGIRQVNRSVIR